MKRLIAAVAACVAVAICAARITPINNGQLYTPLDAAGNSVTNLPSPTAEGDAATKGYVDAAISGISITETDPIWAAEKAGYATSEYVNDAITAMTTTFTNGLERCFTASTNYTAAAIKPFADSIDVTYGVTITTNYALSIMQTQDMGTASGIHAYAIVAIDYNDSTTNVADYVIEGNGGEYATWKGNLVLDNVQFVATSGSQHAKGFAVYVPAGVNIPSSSWTVIRGSAVVAPSDVRFSAPNPYATKADVIAATNSIVTTESDPIWGSEKTNYIPWSIAADHTSSTNYSLVLERNDGNGNYLALDESGTGGDGPFLFKTFMTASSVTNFSYYRPRFYVGGYTGNYFAYYYDVTNAVATLDVALRGEIASATNAVAASIDFTSSNATLVATIQEQAPAPDLSAYYTAIETDAAIASATNAIDQAYIREKLGVYLYIGADGGVYVHTGE